MAVFGDLAVAPPHLPPGRFGRTRGHRVAALRRPLLRPAAPRGPLDHEGAVRVVRVVQRAAAPDPARNPPRRCRRATRPTSPVTRYRPTSPPPAVAEPGGEPGN